MANERKINIESTQNSKRELVSYVNSSHGNSSRKELNLTNDLIKNSNNTQELTDEKGNSLASIKN